MKLLLMGDLHLTGKNPSSRKDFLPNVQYNKFEKVLDVALNNKIDFILQPGDFFDSCTPTFSVLSRYIKLIRAHNEVFEDPFEILTIFGQHDLYMWNLNAIDRTALMVMDSARVVNIVEDVCVISGESNGGAISFYGVSWGQDLNLEGLLDKKYSKNILMVHGAIGDVPLFQGHEIVHPKKYAEENNGFNLILCGDYHFPFEYKVGDTLIINPGVFSRTSISEKSVKPSVVIYDTDTGEYEWITISDDMEVFKNQEEIVSGRSEFWKSGTLKELLDQMDGVDDISISFEDNIKKGLESKDFSEEAKRIIIDTMNRCNEERKDGKA